MPWEYDRNHSLIGFTTKHLGITTVHGRFDDADVQLDIDSENPTQWSMNAVIRAESLNTGIQRRDDHVRSESFLHVDQFPEITFKTLRTERRGDRFALIGALTMHGITREVELDVSYNGEAVDRGVYKRGFSAQTTINRFDYGVGDPEGTWTAAPEIRFNLELEARKVE